MHFFSGFYWIAINFNASHYFIHRYLKVNPCLAIPPIIKDLIYFAQVHSLRSSLCCLLPL
jgi:hypothetical protein